MALMHSKRKKRKIKYKNANGNASYKMIIMKIFIKRATLTFVPIKFQKTTPNLRGSSI